MDILTRQRVVELRRRGNSYGEIAEATGASRNTVKSICRRTTETEHPGRTGVCERCGGDLADGRAARRFCSTECRLAWWHAHPERLNRKAIYQFTCKQCDVAFTVYGNRGRKYCSHSCYVRHRFGTRGGKS